MKKQNTLLKPEVKKKKKKAPKQEEEKTRKLRYKKEDDEVKKGRKRPNRKRYNATGNPYAKGNPKSKGNKNLKGKGRPVGALNKVKKEKKKEKKLREFVEDRRRKKDYYPPKNKYKRPSKYNDFSKFKQREKTPEEIQILKERKKEYNRRYREKNKLKIKIKQSYNYHRKMIDGKISQFAKSTINSAENKRKITNILADIFNSINYIIENNLYSEEYIKCIQDRMQEINKFFKKLEQYDWSLGRYLKYEGFHPLFLPEEVFVDSLKIVEVVQNMEDFLATCDQYKVKKKDS